ncbi:hypothetical protein [Fischerella thermalis]|uniref:hypothetical protein n=1 Tax=Fischerella thermalis TaxID=372787 RepID=UPI0021552402|nr:hypothetical protein [Fischerella thermalis]
MLNLSPPQEKLAYQNKLPGEAEFENIFCEPLSVVVEALQFSTTWNDMLNHLPDVCLTALDKYGLVLRIAAN